MYNPLGAGVRWAVLLGEVGLGSTVLILGAGQRGLAAVIAAKAAGAGTVIVTGLAVTTRKLALAREFGADHTINVDEEDTVARVRDHRRRWPDVVLEFTPIATEPVTRRHRGHQARRPGGAGRPERREVASAEHRPDHQQGSHRRRRVQRGRRGYADAIRIIESGRFPLEKLHTHSFGLASVAQAIETLAGEVEGESAVHVSIHPGRG